MVLYTWYISMQLCRAYSYSCYICCIHCNDYSCDNCYNGYTGYNGYIGYNCYNADRRMEAVRPDCKMGVCPTSVGKHGPG